MISLLSGFHPAFNGKIAYIVKIIGASCPKFLGQFRSSSAPLGLSVNTQKGLAKNS